MGEGDVIVAYVGQHGNADDELHDLGVATCERFFKFAQRVVARREDHWRFLPFASHLDVPAYKIDFEEHFAIIAVEDHSDEGIRVTLLLAGKLGAKILSGHEWDGYSLDVIRDRIVLPRLKDHFQ